MSISAEQVKKIAKLSRIKLEDAEISHFQNELSSIIDWVEQLSEVDTEGVDIMTSGIKMPLKKRKDEITDGAIAEDILKNTNSKYGYFTVPKVIE